MTPNDKGRPALEQQLAQDADIREKLNQEYRAKQRDKALVQQQANGDVLQWSSPDSAVPELDFKREKVFADYDVTLSPESRAYRQSKIEAGQWTDQDAAEQEINAFKHANDVLEARARRLMAKAEYHNAAGDLGGNQQLQDEINAEQQDIAAGKAYLIEKLPGVIERHPEYAARLAELKFNADVADLMKDLNPVAYNVTQPLRFAVDQFAANILRTPRTFGAADYGWTDQLADWANKSMETIRSDEPRAFRGNIIEDGKVQAQRILPRLVETVGQSALLVGTSPARAGLLASSFVQTNADYFDQAKEAGLNNTQSRTFATSAAALTSLLELVSPNDVARKAITGRFGEEAVKNIASGLTRKEALAKALGEAVKEAGPEAAQEISQYLGDKAVAHLTNAIVGSQMDDVVRGSEIAENGFLGGVVGALAAGPSAGAIYKGSVSYAATNGPKLKDAIQKSEFLDDKQKKAAVEQVDHINSVYDGNLLRKMDPDRAALIADLILQKQQAEQRVKDNPMDPAVEAAIGNPYKKQVHDLSNRILKELDVETEQRKAALVDVGARKQPADTKVETAPDGKVTLKDKPTAETKPKAAPAESSVVEEPVSSEAAPNTQETNAEAVRSNQGPPAETGGVRTEGQGNGGEDLQLPPQTGTEAGNGEEGLKPPPPKSQRQLIRERRAEQENILKHADNLMAEELGPEGVAERYLANEGRVNTESLIRELGYRNPATQKVSGEFRSKVWAHAKNAPSIETVAGRLAEGTNLEEQDIRDALIDAIRNSPGRVSLIESLRGRLPATLEEQQAKYYAEQAQEDDMVANALESQGIKHDPLAEPELTTFDALTDEQRQALADEYDAFTRHEGESDAADQGGAADAQGEELAQAAIEARRARDKFIEDWNKRGQGLFAPEEGSVQTSIEGGFDNSQENFDALVEPLNERIRQAEKALYDHIVSAPARVSAAAAQTSIDELAAPANNALGRIPVAPIKGDVRGRSEVLKDLSRGVERRILFAKPGRKRAAGTYAPSSAAVKIRYAGDLDTTAHEIGHALDDAYGIVEKAQTNLGALIELNQLSQFGSQPPANYPDPAKYKMNEGMAEYIRARVVNPDRAKADFPELTKLYDENVTPDAKEAIDKFSEDVRAFAGANGVDMVMSNVQFDPKKSPSKVLQSLFDKDSGYQMTFVDKLNANMVNPLRAFEKAIEYANDMRGGDKLNPARDPYMLARLLLHVNGKTSEILESGMIDSKLNVLKDADGNAKNLKWMLEPLDNSSEKTMERDMKDVIAYMVAERTVELSKRFGKENLLTGIGGGIFSDVDVAKRTLDEFEADPSKLSRMKQAATRYREVSNHLLEYMRDKGRISDDVFDEITRNNLQYVALQRIMETEPGEEVMGINSGTKGMAHGKSPIKSIYGSSRTILNPYIGLMDAINKGVKEADRNEVLTTFTDLLRSDRKMGEGEPVPFSDVGVIGKKGDNNAIIVYNKGKAEHWLFQPDVYEALAGLDNEGYKLPYVIRALPALTRWSVTHFPVFAARNIARDIQSRLILSTSYSGKDQATLKPLRDLVGDHEHWREVARAGGLNAGYYMKDDVHYYGLMKEAMREMAKDKRFILLSPEGISHLWHAYENALYKSETVNRVAEYRAAFRQAKAEGMDNYNAQLYAAFRSADLVDFAVAGHWMRIVNQVVPFSNAMVQGFRTAVVHAKRDPAGFAMRLALYATIPKVLEWLLSRANDDDKNEYEQLPAYQRDMFYNFKVGPDKWLSVPAPFELSLPGAAVNRTMSKLSGNQSAFEGYGGSVSNSFLPDESAMAGPLKTLVETATNYDFFRDKPIVPPEEDKLALALRNTKQASRVSQVLQDLTNTDARYWDHILESQLSYYGKTAVKASDLGREGSRHQFDLSDLGFFKQSPAYNSAIATTVIRMASEYGLTSTPEYKRFREAADAYFAAKGSVARDKAAANLRRTAEEILPAMQEEAKEKVEEKKQEDETGEKVDSDMKRRVKAMMRLR